MDTTSNMRFLIALLGAVLAWPVSAQEAVVVVQSRTAQVTWLINQNFEGTGYDNTETWTESSTFNEDYATVILRGSQSGANETATSYAQKDLGADYSELWGHFLFRATDVSPASEEAVVELYDSTNTVFARFSIRTTGFVRSNHGGTIGTTSASVGDLADATAVRLWFYFKAETSDGANDGVFSMWTSTAAETSRSSGDQLISQTNGAMHQGVRYVRLVYGLSANVGIYDQVLVDDVSFTSVD